MRTTLLLLLVLACRGESWDRFRGPNGSGVATGAGYPSELSPSKNVLWKVPAPFGKSSPILAGSRIFLTANEGGKLMTICLDARTGRELWRRSVNRERTTPLYKSSDAASSTPAADDQGVYAFFGDYGLVSYTLDGKERWALKLGPFQNFYSMASSPVVVGDLVVLQCDQYKESYLLAVDRKTGKQRWKTMRPGATIGWATPMVFSPEKGRQELVVLGTTDLSSYSPATGERLWWMPLGSMGAIASPQAYGDRILSVTAGTGQPWMEKFDAALAKYDSDKDGFISKEEFRALKDFFEHFGWMDANGDDRVNEEEWDAVRNYGMGEFGAISVKPMAAQGKLEPGAVAWRFKKNLPYIPSGLLYENVFYLLKDGGIVTSLDPGTGAVAKEGRLKEALGEYFASPVAADGKLYMINGEGKAVVVKAGPQWEVLTASELGDEVYATPALASGRVYVRTRGAVYCFGSKR